MPDDAPDAHLDLSRHDFNLNFCPNCGEAHWRCDKCGRSVLEWPTVSASGVRSKTLADLKDKRCPGPPKHPRKPIPDPCPQRRRTDRGSTPTTA